MKGGEGELEREGKYSKISHAFHVSPKKMVQECVQTTGQAKLGMNISTLQE